LSWLETVVEAAAKLVVVALVRKVVPNVEEAEYRPPKVLNTPATVVEPVIASEPVEVAWPKNRLPASVVDADCRMVKVDEALLKIPWVKPITEEVELPQAAGVKSKAPATVA
jgi:hypothetical protein